MTDLMDVCGLDSGSYISDDVTLNDIDFEWVDSLTASGKDIRKLKRVIILLEQEHFPALLQHAKNKLAEIDPKT